MLKDILSKVEDALDPSVKPISGYDAAFLYSDSPKSPMHIASLTVIEGSIDFEGFKHNIATKLHQVPKFRQRLVNVPMNLGYPYWADDPNFDLDLHIQRIKLPDPADWETLRDLTASITSTPLDLRRPLWSMTFVEGLNNVSQVPEGSVALISKVHHVMIDGMSGMGIMGILLSFDPSDKPDMNEQPRAYKPDPLPNELTLLAKSGVDFLKDPLKLPRVAGKTLVKVAQGQMSKRMQVKSDIPKSSGAPKTIFNQSISPRRTWGTALLSLERIKALKNAMDATVNDVILAICAGGIRKYLVEKDKLPGQPLVANVPISIRKEDDGEMKNKISNMLIPIATQIEDPIERLEAIQEQTSRGKVRHKAMGAKTLAKLADAVPFGLANLAAGVYSRYNLNEYHNPPFNVTITNVPGPQFPLYMNGHKILSIFALTPVVDGLGLIIAVLSYNGQVSITATSDAKTMPDADQFARYIRESANELEAIILSKEEEKKEQKKAKPKSDPFFTALRKRFKAKKKWEKKFIGTYQVTVNGCIEPVHQQITVTETSASVKKGVAKNPKATLMIDDEYLSRVHKKELRLEEAQIQGRIKMEGAARSQKYLMQLLS